MMRACSDIHQQKLPPPSKQGLMALTAIYSEKLSVPKNKPMI